MPVSSRLTAAVMSLAVVGLLLTWAAGGTRPPCVRATVTDPCTDDALRWNGNAQPPGTANVKVEAYTTFVSHGHPSNVLSWEKWKQAGARSQPVGCADLTICVYPVDAAGNPLTPVGGDPANPVECFRWAPGGGRELDDTNGAGPWVGELMCGGP